MALELVKPSEIYEGGSDAKEQQQPSHSTRIQGAPKDARSLRSDDACFLQVRRYYHLLRTVTLFGFFLKEKTKTIKTLIITAKPRTGQIPVLQATARRGSKKPEDDCSWWPLNTPLLKPNTIPTNTASPETAILNTK